jgi:ElaB/YqjD/DUF883 family membrane-anchored ribosome-binding protein
VSQSYYPQQRDQSTVSRASEAAVQTAARVQEAASEQFDKVERNIRRNPLAAVGIAAGVGLLMAMLARR